MKEMIRKLKIKYRVGVGTQQNTERSPLVPSWLFFGNQIRNVLGTFPVGYFFNNLKRTFPERSLQVFLGLIV